MRSATRAACLVLLVTRTMRVAALELGQRLLDLGGGDRVEARSRARRAGSPPAPGPARAPGTAAAAGRRRGGAPSSSSRSLTSSQRNAARRRVSTSSSSRPRSRMPRPAAGRRRCSRRCDHGSGTGTAKTMPTRRRSVGHVDVRVVDVLAVEQDAPLVRDVPCMRSFSRFRLRRNVRLAAAGRADDARGSRLRGDVQRDVPAAPAPPRKRQLKPSTRDLRARRRRPRDRSTGRAAAHETSGRTGASASRPRG